MSSVMSLLADALFILSCQASRWHARTLERDAQPKHDMAPDLSRVALYGVELPPLSPSVLAQFGIDINPCKRYACASSAAVAVGERTP